MPVRARNKRTRAAVEELGAFGHGHGQQGTCMGSGSAEGDLLTVDTAAAVWGVSRSTVYNWMHAGTLKCFRTDDKGDVVFRREDVRRAAVLRRREVHERGVEPSL